MLKQIYRFLSILLVSNLLFTPTVLGESQKDPNNSTCACHKKSIIQRLFCHKKPAVQKPDNQQSNNNQNTSIQQPNNNNQGGYVTKYGVYYPDDIFDTYPPQQPEAKKQ